MPASVGCWSHQRGRTKDDHHTVGLLIFMSLRTYTAFDGNTSSLFIRNLALALKDIQLITRVIPYVLLHFQECHSGHRASTTSSSPSTNGIDLPYSGTKAEGKQLEVLHRQFDQACKHLKNHSDELYRVSQYDNDTTSQLPTVIGVTNIDTLCRRS